MKIIDGRTKDIHLFRFKNYVVWIKNPLNPYVFYEHNGMVIVIDNVS